MFLPARFQRFLAPILVFSTGTLLCALGFLGARRLEQRATRAEFAFASENRASALKREIDTKIAGPQRVAWIH